jgi:hypothetical protein
MVSPACHRVSPFSHLPLILLFVSARMSAPGTVALLLSQSLPSGPESDSGSGSWTSLVEESGRDLRSVSICDRVCVREEKEEGRSRVEGLLDRVGLNYSRPPLHRHVSPGSEISIALLSSISPRLNRLVWWTPVQSGIWPQPSHHIIFF